ncbi:hypothetical protein DFJ73DRAFT_827420 [Zopfochytrium polystomum]|nr:hypothetical protein DFJ73DRAFT_827420 [Zopfochytrium polystomum]
MPLGPGENRASQQPLPLPPMPSLLSPSTSKEPGAGPTTGSSAPPPHAFRTALAAQASAIVPVSPPDSRSSSPPQPLSALTRKTTTTTTTTIVRTSLTRLPSSSSSPLVSYDRPPLPPDASSPEGHSPATSPVSPPSTPPTRPSPYSSRPVRNVDRSLRPSIISEHTFRPSTSAGVPASMEPSTSPHSGSNLGPRSHSAQSNSSSEYSMSSSVVIISDGAVNEIDPVDTNNEETEESNLTDSDLYDDEELDSDSAAGLTSVVSSSFTNAASKVSSALGSPPADTVELHHTQAISQVSPVEVLHSGPPLQTSKADEVDDQLLEAALDEFVDDMASSVAPVPQPVAVKYHESVRLTGDIVRSLRERRSENSIVRSKTPDSLSIDIPKSQDSVGSISIHRRPESPIPQSRWVWGLGLFKNAFVSKGRKNPALEPPSPPPTPPGSAGPRIQNPPFSVMITADDLTGSFYYSSRRRKILPRSNPSWWETVFEKKEEPAPNNIIQVTSTADPNPSASSAIAPKSRAFHASNTNSQLPSRFSSSSSTQTGTPSIRFTNRLGWFRGLVSAFRPYVAKRRQSIREAPSPEQIPATGANVSPSPTLESHLVSISAAAASGTPPRNSPDSPMAPVPIFATAPVECNHCQGTQFLSDGTVCTDCNTLHSTPNAHTRITSVPDICAPVGASRSLQTKDPVLSMAKDLSEPLAEEFSNGGQSQGKMSPTRPGGRLARLVGQLRGRSNSDTNAGFSMPRSFSRSSKRELSGQIINSSNAIPMAKRSGSASPSESPTDGAVPGTKSPPSPATPNRMTPPASPPSPSSPGKQKLAKFLRLHKKETEGMEGPPPDHKESKFGPSLARVFSKRTKSQSSKISLETSRSHSTQLAAMTALPLTQEPVQVFMQRDSEIARPLSLDPGPQSPWIKESQPAAECDRAGSSSLRRRSVPLPPLPLAPSSDLPSTSRREGDHVVSPNHYVRRYRPSRSSSALTGTDNSSSTSGQVRLSPEQRWQQVFDPTATTLDSRSTTAMLRQSSSAPSLPSGNSTNRMASNRRKTLTWGTVDEDNVTISSNVAPRERSGAGPSTSSAASVARYLERATHGEGHADGNTVLVRARASPPPRPSSASTTSASSHAYSSSARSQTPHSLNASGNPTSRGETPTPSVDTFLSDRLRDLYDRVVVKSSEISMDELVETCVKQSASAEELLNVEVVYTDEEDSSDIQKSRSHGRRGPKRGLFVEGDIVVDVEEDDDTYYVFEEGGDRLLILAEEGAPDGIEMAPAVLQRDFIHR